MKNPTLIVTSDFTKQFNQIIKNLKNDEVLVGIPESKTDRKDKNEPINNATILAVNNFGSPSNNIPPRPVMEIGIRKAQESIAEEFKKAAAGLLSKGQAALDLHLGRAGMIAANSVKKVINSQEGIKPPSATTLAIRKAMGFKGTKALIVTAQLRNSITYVVHRKGQ